MWEKRVKGGIQKWGVEVKCCVRKEDGCTVKNEVTLTGVRGGTGFGRSKAEKLVAAGKIMVHLGMEKALNPRGGWVEGGAIGKEE